MPDLPNVSTVLPNNVDKGESLLGNFANMLKTPHTMLKSKVTVDPIPQKKVEYHDGIPRVSWIDDEVNRMNVIELLQFAVVGKFSNGWPELDDLRSVILNNVILRDNAR